MSSKHLLGLINDVLDMSKIESGKLTLTTEQISLKEVVEGIVTSCSRRLRPRSRPLTYMLKNLHRKCVVRRHTPESGFAEPLIECNKYTPEGGSIQLSLSEEASPKGEGHVRIHIKVKDMELACRRIS